MAKSNKIDKNEELIAGYQEAGCLWRVSGCSFFVKNKLKSQIFNYKKSL